MRNTNLNPWPARPGTRYLLVALFSVVVFFTAVNKTIRTWTPLQQFYLGQYIECELGRPNGMQRYSIVQAVSSGGDDLQLANPDVVAGHAIVSNGRRLAFELSPAALRAGDNSFDVVTTEPITYFRGLHWLRRNIYDDRALLQLFCWDILLSLCLFVLGCVAVLPTERKAAMIRKYGRQIRGPESLTTREFNARFKGDGIGIVSKQKRLFSWLFRFREPYLRLPLNKESSGVLEVGVPGAGKSTLIIQILLQVMQRGERAVVWDPHGEYIRRFYRKDRGDVILNPWDLRSPWWDLAGEITHPAVTLTIATSLFPEVPGEHEFFARVCRQIQAYFLSYRPTIHEFAEWLSNPKMIEELLRETALAATIDSAAGPQRAGVISTLSLVVDALKAIPPRDQCQASWNSAEWAQSGRGWIFLTSDSMNRDSLRPLHSALFDLLILRLLNTTGVAGPKTWLCLDELASLHRLPQLVSCLVQTRKTGNPIVYGFQSQSQIEAIYGPEWDAILSVPYAKFFLRTSSPESKEWMSLVVGEVEVECQRQEEQRDASGGVTHSATWEFLTRRLILPSEFGALEDLHGFLVVEGVVTEFRTEYPDLPFVCEAFIARPTHEPTRPLALCRKGRVIFS